MATTLLWTARALLALVLAVALYGAINPQHVHALAVPPDELEHALYAFGMVLLGAAAFPRTSLTALSAPIVLAGVGLEALQAAGLVAGTYEAGDAASNIAGVTAAVFAIWAANARRTGQDAPRLRRRRKRATPWG